MNNDTKKGIVGLCLAYQGQNYGMLLQCICNTNYK